MRSSAAAFAVALLVLPTPASASPAMPRPLERRVEDAELVVVATLRTKPAHAGDEFEVEIEEVLKGARPAGRSPLVVKASSFFTGCVPMPAGTPTPPSIEGRGDRMVLFLDAPENGARQSQDPILLAEESLPTAWENGSWPPAFAPAAIKSLAELDAEDDTDRAVAMWQRGLDGDNPLLVASLLVRARVAAWWLVRSKAGGDEPLGKRIGDRASRELVASRPTLLAHIERLASSENDRLTDLALTALANLQPPQSDEERAIFDRARVAARKATGSQTVGTRGAALEFLCGAGDPTVVDGMIASLREQPQHRPSLTNLAGWGSRLLIRHPALGEQLLGAVVDLLDDEKTAQTAIDMLRQMNNRSMATAAEWRAWWKKRSAK